jgi:hypothetical protein
MKKTTKLTASMVNELTGLQCKKHAAKLADIYKIIDITQILDVKTEICSINFGQQLAWNNRLETYEIRTEGQKCDGIKYTVTTKTGGYSFAVPYKITSFFNDVLNINYTKEIEPQGRVITLSENISDQVKKASKFAASANDLRSNLQGILIEINQNKLSIIGCNGHILYTSIPINCNSDKTEALHITGNFTNLSEINTIEIFDTYVKLGKKEFAIYDVKFPNYKSVIPTYKKQMSFDPKSLINGLKSIKGALNKSTKLVSLYLNGSVQLSAIDDYFENSASIKIPYKYKQFNDCTIGFDANYLTTSLSVFKDSHIKLKTDGAPDKGVILQGLTESVLIMPRMLK